MELHTSQFVEINYEEEHNLIIQTFLPETENMNIDDFKKEMTIFLSKCLEKSASFEIINSHQMKFPIEPELQNWMNTAIFSKKAHLTKKVAFLVPSDIFTHVSIEQTIDDDAGTTGNVKYFDKEDNARKWLFS